MIHVAAYQSYFQWPAVSMPRKIGDNLACGRVKLLMIIMTIMCG